MLKDKRGQRMKTDNMTDETQQKKVSIKALLIKEGVLVPSSEDIEGLSSRGYGRPDDRGLILNFYEALYLLSKGIIEIIDEETNENVTFQSLLRKFRSINEDAWVKFLIYRDLRSRGYAVREGFGFGIDFRVYERGEYGKDAADYLVFGIQEGKPVTVEDLAKTLKYVQNLKKKLILAVLNRRGELVYYSLSQFQPYNETQIEGDKSAET